MALQQYNWILPSWWETWVRGRRTNLDQVTSASHTFYSCIQGWDRRTIISNYCVRECLKPPWTTAAPISHLFMAPPAVSHSRAVMCGAAGAQLPSLLLCMCLRHTTASNKEGADPFAEPSVVLTGLFLDMDLEYLLTLHPSSSACVSLLRVPVLRQDATVRFVCQENLLIANAQLF